METNLLYGDYDVDLFCACWELFREEYTWGPQVVSVTTEAERRQVEWANCLLTSRYIETPERS